MNATARQARQVFVEAVKLAPEQWDAYLAEACGDDHELRDRVRKLLSAHQQAGTFLQKPAADARAQVAAMVERPGAVIGPYKLLEQIGEGGFGVVFMAEQTQPIRRKVALKVLKPGMDTRQVVARFEAERQALALMDHTNIAHVIDGGETASGRPYFVMELVRGIPITEFGDQNHLPVRERLELFVTVCQAVQHAHQKGVIHRDLKPSNIMVTLHDDKPVVKVIDFGIAKATGQQLTEKTLFTSFVQMMGTPMYMSPEQAQLSGLDIDTRSDVYSLGVLLYELLTGTTPFDEARLRTAAYDEIRRIIREEDPPRPSTRFSTLGQAATTLSANRRSDPKHLSQVCRGELDWIVMKALEKDRNRRYESASALAMDVERYLHDEPVQACPPSATYRFRKFARRHKAALGMAMSIALGLLATIAILALSNRWLGQQQQDTEKALAAEKQAKQELKDAIDRERSNFYQYALGLARRDWLACDLEQARRNLDACPPTLRDREWHYLNRVCHAELLQFRPAKTPGRLQYSPDGKSIACGATGVFGAFAIVDAGTGQEQPVSADLATWDSALAFAPDGKQLIWAAVIRPRLLATAPNVKNPPDNFAVSAWDMTKRKHVALLSRDSASQGRVVISPDGSRVALVEVNRTCIHDARTGKELFCLAGPTSDVLVGPVFHPNGKLLASYASDRSLRFWDGATGQPTRKVAVAPGHVRNLAFSSDGRWLAGEAYDSAKGHDGVRVWETETGREIASLRGHSGQVSHLAFSPDGRLSTGGSDKTIILWDVNRGRELLTFRGHSGAILGLAFSPDGRRLASSSSDRTLKIWDASTDETVNDQTDTDGKK